jgi:hypothetical protein
MENSLILLERCLLWLIAKRRKNFKSERFKCVQCPLCGAANQNIGRPFRSATNLGRVRFPREDHIAPVEDAVDKQIPV